MYIQTYTHIHLYTNMYINIYIHTYTYTLEYSYIYIHTYLQHGTSQCLSTSHSSASSSTTDAYPSCIDTSMHVHVYTHIHSRSLSHTYTHTNTHTHTHIHTHTARDYAALDNASLLRFLVDMRGADASERQVQIPKSEHAIFIMQKDNRGNFLNKNVNVKTPSERRVQIFELKDTLITSWWNLPEASAETVWCQEKLTFIKRDLQK